MTLRRRTRCARTSRSSGTTAHGKPLVFLDNAASAQKPRAVIDAMQRFYEHELRQHPPGRATSSAERATEAFEGVRGKVAALPRRRRSRGRSSSCAAPPRRSTWSPSGVRAHHARPRATRSSSRSWSTTRTSSPGRWSARRAARSCGSCRSTTAASSCSTSSRSCSAPRTKLVALAHVSNALGTVNPVREIVELAHERGVPVLVDGAQAVPHHAGRRAELDCDFYAFSGHKMFGPTGIGVLYGKRRPARGDAPLPGRRRHDPLGPLREDHLPGPPAQVRGRHARTSPA